MPARISRSDLSTLIHEANLAARRLQRKLRLPAADLDDLRQDLLVDLICRLPCFDASRGSIGAFAGLLLRNQASRIAIRHHQQLRKQGGPLLSLSAPAGDPTQQLIDHLIDTDGLAGWHGQDRCDARDTETRIAVNTALLRLSEADRGFCKALAERSVSELACEGTASRSTLYRRLADLRLTLVAFGLGSAWDDLAAA